MLNSAGSLIFGGVEDLRYASTDLGLSGGHELLTCRSEEEIHLQVNTNLYGPIRIMKPALPFMRAQGFGTIVNISSIGDLLGSPPFVAYSATKHALEGDTIFHIGMREYS